jgi:hypothetical protein
MIPLHFRMIPRELVCVATATVFLYGLSYGTTFAQVSKASTAASNSDATLQQNGQKTDTSSHTVQLIPVERDIKLEVLDWGGTGRRLVLLAGLATLLMSSTSSLLNLLPSITFTESPGAVSGIQQARARISQLQRGPSLAALRAA